MQEAAVNRPVKQLFDKISHARYCVALTGAGISTLSGIPDFRGERGIYREGIGGVTGGTTGGALAEKLFDIHCFEEDPSFFYKNAAFLVYEADEREPSVVHTVLAELERREFLKAVITQNIDLLHQKGGSRRVIEIHGSPRQHYCLRCGGIRMGFEEAAALVKAGKLPRCPQCGRVLKPAITFFGESLPLDARREAEAEAQEADLMLILGTSLRVFPAADLPRTTLRRGGELVIVNNRATPLDDRAVLHFENLAEVFSGLGDLL